MPPSQAEAGVGGEVIVRRRAHPDQGHVAGDQPPVAEPDADDLAGRAFEGR